MTPILQQFLSESRDFLQGISKNLLLLETSPADPDLMGELFRLVHTLKGNSGLFDLPEMTRVLHAAEDLMVVVRDGSVPYDRSIADGLLEAMDLVALLLDEIESSGKNSAAHSGPAVELAKALRRFIPVSTAAGAPVSNGSAGSGSFALDRSSLDRIPQALRAAWLQKADSGGELSWVLYTPEAGCFFKGEDPFFQARGTPGILWGAVMAPAAWPPLGELDAYQCALGFQIVSEAPRAEIEDYFRYVPEQIGIAALPMDMLAQPTARPAIGPAPLIDSGAATAIPSTATEPRIQALIDLVFATQISVLEMPDDVSWLPGRLMGVGAALSGCYRSIGREAELPSLEAALATAIDQSRAAPLLTWLRQRVEQPRADTSVTSASVAAARPQSPLIVPPVSDSEPKFGRRADDFNAGNRTLKVDQNKIDRLMNLIGEMVVAKNGLPYLAGKAENVFGARELSREIKANYAVINRIAEEMQDAIMQVRMMPVSFVFQRFPRLVRDISRKLGKEVELVMEGEDTEADKNIIEALADPLIHILRNSLDHGIELPAVRQAAGKSAVGRLVIRASQEADRVVIDISDDGKGIDPEVIKRKAYEKGLIDEAVLQRISDQDAINLVFAAGFSTNEVVSDLSGRGVGMDVVRSAVERVNGSVSLESTAKQGTRLRLSLPLSMAVTDVIVIESDQQIFGVPMKTVVETVRVKRSAIHTIKNNQTTVLRGQVVPLRPLNELLARDKPQHANEEDELAALVIRVHGEPVGIVVDDFREVVDIILKPLTGILGGLPGYAGSALLGDGSVLMVLNPQELV